MCLPEKFTFTIILFCLVVSWFPSMGQTKTETYTITTLEGIEQRVIVNNDWQDRRLRVICGNDTISFTDNWYGSVSATFLTKNFLKIIYSRRGGSGIHNDDLLLICVKNNKLHSALDIVSYSEFIYGGDDVDDYNASLKIAAGSNENIRLELSANREYAKILHKKNYRTAAILDFDKNKCVFFSRHEYIDNVFHVYNFADEKTTDKRFTGTYPMVDIGRRRYYFAKGTWYRNFTGLPDFDKIPERRLSTDMINSL